jgi:thiol-disulfide isomerase/thioredoxin
MTAQNCGTGEARARSSRTARRRRVTAVIAAAVVLASCAAALDFCTTSGRASSRVVDGNIVMYAAGHEPLVPAIAATSLTGAPVRLSAYRSSVLVLNFWASWCAPCNAEASTLEVAYQEYHSQGVDFLGDDLDDSLTGALSFDREYGISYASINDPSDAFVQQFSQAALINDPPTTAVIKSGHLVGMILGRASSGDLAALIHQAKTANA